MRALGVQSVPAVLLILKDKAQSQERREAAAEILGGLRHRVAVETLVEVLCEGEQRLSWLCMSALTDIRSRKGSHRLMEIVRGAYPLQARQEAIYTLWHLNDVRAEGLFIQLSARVADEEEYSRDMATEALGNTHWRRATQKAISKRLFDPSVSVRYSALCAAARVRNEPHPDLMSALQAKLSDPDQVDSNRVIATFAAEILEHISLRRAGQRIY
jgi:HEAT repeat protein